MAAGKPAVKVETRLIRTRSPGAAIVEEAQHRNAEIIYLGTAHAPPSERALGPTASYLLAHRPCRVVIETPPATAHNGVASGANKRPAPAPEPVARAPRRMHRRPSRS